MNLDTQKVYQQTLVVRLHPDIMYKLSSILHEFGIPRFEVHRTQITSTQMRWKSANRIASESKLQAV